MSLIETGAGVYRCRCRNCGIAYVQYRFSDFAYGEWLIQTIDGRDYAYLQGIDNPDFYDMSRIIKKMYPHCSDTDRSYYLHKVIGKVCDQVNGKPLDMFLNPKCPQCGSNDIEELDPSPQSSVRLTLPIVTFTYWQKQSEAVKMDQIERILRAEGL